VSARPTGEEVKAEWAFCGQKGISFWRFCVDIFMDGSDLINICLTLVLKKK